MRNLLQQSICQLDRHEFPGKGAVGVDKFQFQPQLIHKGLGGGHGSPVFGLVFLCLCQIFRGRDALDLGQGGYGAFDLGGVKFPADDAHIGVKVFGEDAGVVGGNFQIYICAGLYGGAVFKFQQKDPFHVQKSFFSIYEKRPVCKGAKEDPDS